ncbi:MAG: ferritin-like domain-containing protein [Flavobacterium sp.]
MNIIKFIESFTNEGFLNATGSRRDSFGQFGTLGKGLATMALPFGIGAIALNSNKANAASAAFLAEAAETPTQALQLALTLEYLEEEFYQIGMDTVGLIPAEDRPAFSKILQHESDHVDFLQAGLGNNSIDKPMFDFTVGGAFPTFTDYPTFLALAQAFEDTGVRAYKGQAGNLISTPDLLQAALQIHSVEARHASMVRRIRGQKGWIVGNDRGGLPVQAQPVYDGEENAIQAGFNTSAVGSISPAAGPESFDEPLTGAQATSIASLFIVQ